MGRRGPGAGLPGRVRRAVGPEPAKRRPGLHALHRQPGPGGPRLRPPSAGHLGAFRGRCAAGAPAPQRRQGTRALLRLPGRGRRIGQDLHGARRGLRRCGRGADLAPGQLHRRVQPEHAGQHPGEIHLPRQGRACRAFPAPGPQRARRRGADERGRELPARAHAHRCAGALRHHRLGRPVAQRGAGARRGAVPGAGRTQTTRQQRCI